MLNPAFPNEAEARFGPDYVLPQELARLVANSNESVASGAELRLQPVYGEELWRRMRSLQIDASDLEGRDVMDACCGTGFLSYHLLQRARPRSLALVDISGEELAQAERLLSGLARSANGSGSPSMSFRVEDLAHASSPDESFDAVIGNSFLHHFPSVPEILQRVHALLRPGGSFIGLHEPTPAAVAWESGHVRPIAGLIRRGGRSIDRFRPADGTVLANGGDVWLFSVEDLAQLLDAAGFIEVTVRPRYLLRPLVVALLGMHLTAERPELSPTRAVLLRATIAADSALARVAPADWFGGLCFCARRP
jgi:ubiquinone/menaquinone biosynthesis C-methylase UbiE